MGKINWKSHIREFLVVVVGILMAFQLDRYSEESKEQKLIQEHLTYLKEETKLNLKQIEGSIALAESNIKKADSLISIIKRKENTSTINFTTYSLMNIGYLYLRKNAYNSLIESGDIRFLKNFEDKKRIVDLYEYYGWTESFDDAHRTAFYEDLFPYIKSNFDLVGNTIQADDIYYDKQFLNSISTYRYTLDLKLKKFKDCKAYVESFLKEMDN